MVSLYKVHQWFLVHHLKRFLFILCVFPCFIFIMKSQSSWILNCPFNSTLFSIISFCATLNRLFNVFNFSSTTSWLTVKLPSRLLVLSFNCWLNQNFFWFLVKYYSVFHWAFCSCFFKYVWHWLFMCIRHICINENFLYPLHWIIIHGGWNKWNEMDERYTL